MPASLIIGADRIVTNARIDVRNAFDHALVDTLSLAEEEHVDQAVAAARAASKQPFPVHQRVHVLYEAADRLEAHAAEIADLLAQEGSKTISEARNEPKRAAEVL
ncbi:MAG: aldehyde dehydrogenase family protein, partial [Bacteroidetes bacterium]|nr:aldehyde dehydrogenase family protein [Bacteroidota bacterium]